MAFPQRLLGDDERLVLHQHPHWKVLVLPTLLLPVIVGAAAFGIAAMPDGSAQAPARWAVLGVALIALVVLCVVPWLRWRTTHFILTDQRIVLRSGILARTGRDIPLARVNDVTFSHSLVERLLRCGRLMVESGGERGQVVLDDVARVESVQRTLAELVEDSLDPSHRVAPDQRREPAAETGDRTTTELASGPATDGAPAGA
ncbi:MAG: PH domain-containing protein [Frankiaceae bacterium]